MSASAELGVLLEEVESLARRLETVSSKLRELIGRSNGGSDDDVAARVSRYLSPAFTDQLIEHVHRAKRMALMERDNGDGHAAP